MRTPVKIPRNIVRLHSKGGYNNRTVGLDLQLNHKTVGASRQKFRACGLNEEQLKALNDIPFAKWLGINLQSSQVNQS